MLSLNRETLKKWENCFVKHGVLGVLPSLSFFDVDVRLEVLVKLVRKARPHANSSYILQLADALEIPKATMEIIYRIQLLFSAV